MSDVTHDPPQRRVARFSATHGLVKTPVFACLDLTAEVGEVAKALLSATGYGRDTSAAALAAARPALTEEIGDALYSLYDLANAAGVDADSALDAAMAKYARRLAERGRASSA